MFFGHVGCCGPKDSNKQFVLLLSCWQQGKWRATGIRFATLRVAECLVNGVNGLSLSNNRGVMSLVLSFSLSLSAVLSLRLEVTIKSAV